MEHIKKHLRGESATSAQKKIRTKKEENKEKHLYCKKIMFSGVCIYVCVRVEECVCIETRNSGQFPVASGQWRGAGCAVKPRRTLAITFYRLIVQHLQAGNYLISAHIWTPANKLSCRKINSKKAGKCWTVEAGLKLKLDCTFGSPTRPKLATKKIQLLEYINLTEFALNYKTIQKMFLCTKLMNVRRQQNGTASSLCLFSSSVLRLWLDHLHKVWA